MDYTNCFAEVLESSLIGWLAQSWEWDHFPAFGSFVAIEEKKRTLFGIVHQVQTGSMDPLRYPFPYKKTEQELKDEQPQIFEFLKTTFSCVTVGYTEKNSHTITYLLAPEPPKIHSFISRPDTQTLLRFFANTHYIHILFAHSAHIFSLDELMLAMLKHLHLHMAQKNYIDAFMHTYSLLTGNDYRRIKLFLQRAEHIFEHDGKF